jgi:ADP-heptose:LPS heptosyltransferase
VAVTSVLLDAVKRKYTNAEIHFVGPRKSYELFETDSRILHFPAPYARDGSLAERLKASASLWLEDGLVVDSDSRLTQLGLITVCQEARYFLFPSRDYGGDGNDRLPALAARWAQETFGIEGARPYIAPPTSSEPPANITVSLGVGDNATKRRDDDFEKLLIAMLATTGRTVIIDKGGDQRERERVEYALTPGVRTHDGSFASFASLISQSRLYVGYDSAGGHAASACGVPVISIAKGFVSPRMAARWRPRGTVIDGGAPDALAQIRAALGFF